MRTLYEKLLREETSKYITYATIFVIAILVIMYVGGVRDYSKENMMLMTKKKALQDETQKLEAEVLQSEMLENQARDFKIKLLKVDEVVQKFDVFYGSKDYEIVNVKEGRHFFIKKKEITNFYDILEEAKKCRKLFKKSCVIETVMPFKAKVYYED